MRTRRDALTITKYKPVLIQYHKKKNAQLGIQLGSHEFDILEHPQAHQQVRCVSRLQRRGSHRTWKQWVSVM